MLIICRSLCYQNINTSLVTQDKIKLLLIVKSNISQLKLILPDQLIKPSDFVAEIFHLLKA